MAPKGTPKMRQLLQSAEKPSDHVRMEMAAYIRAQRQTERQERLIEAVTEPRVSPGTPAAVRESTTTAGVNTPTQAAGEAGAGDFRKGYKRPDGCPVPDWFVDEHRKPVEKWQTKRERGFASGGGGKRHKPFGSGSHGNKR